MAAIKTIGADIMMPGYPLVEVGEKFGAGFVSGSSASIL
jgi:hypothetical protein